MSVPLRLRAVLPSCVLVVAFVYSFSPQRTGTSERPSRLSALSQAARAIEAGESFAAGQQARVAFVILLASGEQLIATEMKGSGEAARQAAFRNAVCMAAAIDPASTKKRSRAEKPRGSMACRAVAAQVVRRAHMPLTIVSVAGALRVRDEQILGATVASFEAEAR